MDSAWLISLLHFADSAFPTGGFAHSLGLETYCQTGLIRDGGGLEAFLRAELEGAAAPADATAAAAVLSAGQRRDLAACRELDETLDAMKPAVELRGASRQMGRQTLRVAHAVTGDRQLETYERLVEEGVAPGHQGVAVGLAGAALDWTAEAAAAVLLYSTASLLVGAGLRLLPLGQLEGQRILWALGPLVARLAAEAARRPPAELWSFAPGLEIQAMRHARLDQRLFRS
ncbi:MAG: hypothetical protein L0027_02035 [Candidatus Rokubacteria bacterium]|nr:hypothetical protein [Candidatus Rokubacteria bacterium]